MLTTSPLPSHPWSFLWTDDSCVTHGIWQGEGGELGDPLMPMLCALGQHHSRIQIHAGKTQVWNRGGFEPPGHAALLEVARMADPEAKLWFGDKEDRPEERGIRVLGTPLGSDEFVRVQLQSTVDSHWLLFHRIPAVQDLQSAWLLLLFCAASRATHYLRVCRPSVTDLFARQHDAHIWQCVVALLGHDPPNPVWEVGSLPFHMGGLRLRSAVRTAPAAHWGSWADCLHTISERAHRSHNEL